MQEAYCPPCSEYSLCCPTWVPPLGGTQSGTPRGVPSQVPPRGVPQVAPGGYPDPPGGTWSGTPPGGVPRPPLGGYPVRGGTWSGTPLLPHGILGNVAKHYGIWVPPLWTDRLMDGQTRVKTLPSLVLRTWAVINMCLTPKTTTCGNKIVNLDYERLSRKNLDITVDDSLNDYCTMTTVHTLIMRSMKN